LFHKSMTPEADKSTEAKAGPRHRSLPVLWLIVVVALSAVFWNQCKSDWAPNSCSAAKPWTSLYSGS
jgi:hypothetical protein